MIRRRKICRILLRCVVFLFCGSLLSRILELQIAMRAVQTLDYLSFGERENSTSYFPLTIGIVATRRASTTTTITTTATTTTTKSPKSRKVTPRVYTKRNKPNYGARITYPLDINMQEVVRKTLVSKENVDFEVINKHDFKYVFNPSFRCNKELEKPPLVVILVKSAFENIKKRNAIRSTWGNITDYQGDIRLVFLLGFSNKGKENVTEEYEQHKDIVCEDFMDTYWNNTHKMIMGFKWSVTYCSDSKFFFFVDDDYFVNVDALLSYVRNEKEKDLFSGFLLSRSQPYRDVGGKWYVSVEDYPHHHYPPYLAGGAYITSVSVARMFVAVFPYVKYLVIDDAYLGIVAQKLNLKPKHNRKFLYIRSGGSTSKNNVIACHGYGDEKKLISDWELFVKSKNSKDSIKQSNVKTKSNPHVIPAKVKRN